MNYALVGYGRMGRAIDAEAASRGHRRSAVLDRSGAAAGLGPASLSAAEVAFEFTEASAAEANVVALLESGLAVICGTTGWQPGPAIDDALRSSSGALILAPNYSLGVNLFFRLTRQAARLLGAAGMHQPFICEAHHRGKRDAPSGTAKRLAEILIAEHPRLSEMHAGDAAEPLAEHVLQISSVRAGSEPGTHTVGFDGEHDLITLRHRARGRGGFARGAVTAAEWLLGKRGLHRFDEVLDDILQRGRHAASNPGAEEA